MRLSLSLSLSTLLLVALVGCDATDVAPADGASLSPKANVVHQFNVGGADNCEATGQPTGCDANFSAHGMVKADGSVSGTHTDVLRQDGGNDNLHGTVDCINVYEASLGTIAVWGGEVTTGSYAGTRYISAAADGGPGGDDYISYTYIDTGDRTCDAPGFTLSAFELYRGQVRVR